MSIQLPRATEYKQSDIAKTDCPEAVVHFGRRHVDQARRVSREYTATSDAIRTLASHRTAAAEIQPPDHILRTIGARPDDPDRRQAWRTAVHAVEEYRACWHITDPTQPLGTRAEHPPCTHIGNRPCAQS